MTYTVFSTTQQLRYEITAPQVAQNMPSPESQATPTPTSTPTSTERDVGREKTSVKCFWTAVSTVWSFGAFWKKAVACFQNVFEMETGV